MKGRNLGHKPRVGPVLRRGGREPCLEAARNSGLSSCSPQAHSAPRCCKAAGSWPTATHGLRGPAPRPLALFDRGSGLQKKEAQVQSQDGVCCGAWWGVACICKRRWGKGCQDRVWSRKTPSMWTGWAHRGHDLCSNKSCLDHKLGCHHIACACVHHNKAQAQV